MSMTPDVSVIVPTHNVGHWVRECLSSILEDQDVDLEVIVVDDNSTDDTWDVVTSMAADDERLRPVRSIGSGGGQARNFGVELARGEYLVFCDGDDLVPRGAYTRMLSSARETGADMVVGNFLKFWSTRTWRPSLKWPAFDGNRIGVSLPDAVSLIRNRACWNRMFRRRFWLDERIYFPSVPRSNDIVPMTKALVSAKRIDVITDDVYLYRGRPGDGSMSAQAGGLESYTSYLAQERECSAHVASVGDAALRAEYDALFLAADGWVHLRNFLAQAQCATYNDDALEHVRRHLVAVLDSLDTNSFARLPLERRVVYALAAAGSWPAAGRLMRAIKPAAEAMPHGTWFLEHVVSLTPSRILPAGLLNDVVTRWLMPSLFEHPETITQDARTALASHADLFCRVYSDSQALHQLPASGQQLALALMTGRIEGIEACLSGGLLTISPKRVAVQRGRLVVIAAVAGAKPDKLRIYIASGDARRDARYVRWTADSGTVEASIPLSRLAVGEWSLRLAGRDLDSTVDAELIVPSSAVEERGRRAGRVIIRPRSDGRTGEVVVVRRHVALRAGRRLVRKAARRARQLLGAP